MRRIAVLLSLLLLAGCAGGVKLPPQGPPAGHVTIADPISYLAQSVRPDGNPGTPLRAADPIAYSRWDIGRHVATASFLTGPNSSITVWDWPPLGPYVRAEGDGGESYEFRDDTVRITQTACCGAPSAAISWVALTTSTIECAQGWTVYNAAERGCRVLVNYPAIGSVDTVISEHNALGVMERIFLGKGWGRLAWQTFRIAGHLDDVSRCPDFGWNQYQPGWALTDCRYAVNIEPADGALTGAMLWHP